jgi:hypothetical protein
MDFRGHDGGNRPGAGNRTPGSRPNAGSRASSRPGGNARGPAARGGHDSAFSNMGNGRGALAQAQRGHASLNAGGGHPGLAARGGGGGRVGGGGGGRGGGHGGGRRSDIRAKHDIVLLGRIDNGLGFYRFIYNGGTKVYVGVMAQEVEAVAPTAVARDRDGYLTVNYEKLGLPFESYDRWLASGARIPSTASIRGRTSP